MTLTRERDTLRVEVVMDEHESPGQRVRRMLEGEPGPWQDPPRDHADAVDTLMSATWGLARDLIASEEREAALQAQVADLQAAVERVRPVVEALAAACEAEAGEPEERPHVLAEVMIALGRPLTGFDEDAAWLRSLLPTAPESVPVLAPSQPAPAPDGRFTVDSAWRFE